MSKKIKPIIFLDIDGVLNSSYDKKLIYDTFEVKKLKMLFKLLKRTHSDLMIISSRARYQDEREMIKKAFKRYKKRLTFLENSNKYRAKEILEYLKDINYSSYVIIDDNEYDYRDYPEANRRYVEINCVTGITKENIEEAYLILNKHKNV